MRTPPPLEPSKLSLFKKKGAAIGKVASMNFGNKAVREEQKRQVLSAYLLSWMWCVFHELKSRLI